MSTEKAVNENFAGNPNFSNNFFFLVETSCHVKKYMYELSFVLTGVLAKMAYNLSSKLMPLATKEVSTKKILMTYSILG